MEGVVGKALLREYQRLSAEERHTFNKWLKANAMFGAMLFIGLLAMAWMGNSVGRTDATIDASSKSSIARSK